MEKRIEDAGLAIRQEVNKVLSALYKLQGDAEDVIADIEEALETLEEEDAENLSQGHDELRNARDNVIEWIEAIESARDVLENVNWRLI